jgi:hypothetical protein
MISKYHGKGKFYLFILCFLVLSVPAVMADSPKEIYGGTVRVYTGYEGTNSYFDLVISGVIGGGYLPVDGTYDGWCVDTGHTIDPKQWFDHSRLYCSILAGMGDPSIPECIREQADWNRVNYILTNWYQSPKIPAFQGATYGDIQQALWHFGDDGYDYTDPHSTSPDFTPEKVGDIIQSAVDNGGDFVPVQGQTMAVIVDAHKNPGEENCVNQLIVLGIQLPPDYHVPEFPLGTITALLTPLAAFAYTSRRRR